MDKLDIRRVTIYLIIAFGYSWAIALIMYLNGGLANSPALVEGTPITLAFGLLILYMAGPTLGNIGARIFTREGRSDLWLRPKIRIGWKYWLITWFLTPILIVAGAALYFFIFPADLSITQAEAMLLPTLPDLGLPSWMMVIGLIALTSLISPITNSIAVFGEEFGWRGYLQPKLLPIGERKMYLLVGVIWGIWHWPVIWMGFNYPGYPLWGSIAMVWFTIVVGTFLGWATLRAKSIWPAVIGHSVLNGLAPLPALFIAGQTNPLIGPLVVGIIGGFFFALTTILIIWKAKS